MYEQCIPGPTVDITLHALERWQERFGGDEESLLEAIRESRRLRSEERKRFRVVGNLSVVNDELKAIFVIKMDEVPVLTTVLYLREKQKKKEEISLESTRRRKRYLLRKMARRDERDMRKEILSWT